ncbi:hypothetical protein HY68_35155 [Streptomyces sp. AcH 505]|uniref:hypothetical protein n=1 Tax=Streptomyces sp. AcH 505 TaxID=352211 RepID=UPI000591A585|nr:hypothetical protein HY68_35155 [Streptomyces sp. AcH 505]
MGRVTAGGVRTEEVPLTFVGDGMYAVDVVRDGPDGLVGESREVTSQHVLTLDIPADGGVAAAATT